MTALTSSRSRRERSFGGARLTAAVVLSRVVACLAGVLGATQWARVHGWHVWDWQRLTQHLGSVGNALAGSAVRWDSIHYLDIAAYGYRVKQDTVFFPLYPLVIKVVGAVISSDVLGGVLISLVAFAVALVLLHRLASEELGPRAADATIVLLAFAPMSFFFSALYTESLFLALSLGAFYAGLRERWLLAGLCGAAATLTRVPGVLLFVPLALMYWQARDRRPIRAAPLLLIPVALAAFLAYLDHRGFGLTAPLTNQESLHFHSSAGPISAVIDAVKDGATGFWRSITGATLVKPTIGSPFSPSFGNLIELLVLIACVVTLVHAFRALPIEYGIYALLVLIICIWSPSKGVPLRSLDRYALVIFPLWMAAGDLLARRRLLVPVAVIGAAAMFFYAIEFARWSFVA